MFKEFDIVMLKADDSASGVLATDIGAIVDVLSENEFTVEFTNDKGETIMPALYKTYTADELIKVD